MPIKVLRPALVESPATFTTLRATSVLSIPGFEDVSASLAAGGGIPTLQQVTDQGSSTTTPITASIISASGDLLGTNILFTGNVSGSGVNSSYFGDEFNAHSNDANSGFTLLSLGSKPSLWASGTSIFIGNATNSSQTGIKLVGEVTASGNISASGQIIGDVVDTSFENFLNFEAATSYTYIAPFPLTINFTGSSTSSMEVVGFVTASANTDTFSTQQSPPITLNRFDKLKITPSSSGLFTFSGSRTI